MSETKAVAPTWKHIGESWVIGKHRYFKCICVCGTTKNVRADGLRSGRSKSCGCIARDLLKKYGITHGLSHTLSYRSWLCMMSRCYSQIDINWKNYGGRGIVVCERWQILENFIADMGERAKGYTLERNDVDGNYEPSNCRWATYKEQANNKRPYKVVRGPGSSGAKLTEQQVREIKSLIGKTTYAEISHTYGVTASNITSIKKGATWAHVE